VTRNVSKGCVPIEVSFALQIDSDAEVGIRVAVLLKVLAMAQRVGTVCRLPRIR
jgi:hypothetical protein